MGANIILAIGALLIFGTFLSSSNRLMTGNTQIAEQNEYFITAISLAQSVIDEAKTKAFDQKTAALVFPIVASDSLTVPAKLGTDGAAEKIVGADTLSATGYRSTTLFNDVDDYDRYTRTVNTLRAEGYQVSVRVQYAKETSPDVTMGVQTFCKRMDVSVSSPYLPNAVSLSYAFTY